MEPQSQERYLMLISSEYMSISQAWLWESLMNHTLQVELKINMNEIALAMKITNVTLCADGLSWLVRETRQYWASSLQTAPCQECGETTSSQTRIYSKHAPMPKLSLGMLKAKSLDWMAQLGRGSTVSDPNLKRSLDMILKLPCISCACCSKPK